MTPRQRPLRHTRDLAVIPPLQLNPAGAALWSEGFMECRRYVLTERLALAQAVSALERISVSKDGDHQHLVTLAGAAVQQIKRIREEGYGKRSS